MLFFLLFSLCNLIFLILLVVQYDILTTKGHTKAILDQLTLLAQRLVDSRKKLTKNRPETAKRFFDINFKELIDDPSGTVKKIYDYFGYDFTEEYQQKIEDYINNQPRNNYSRPSYSMDELELTEDDINQKFESYISEYSKFF